MHYHIMVSAAEHFRELKSSPPCITLDKDTKQRIETIFLKIDEKLTDRTLSKDELLYSLAKAEFSEWNNMFLYVVNTLKEKFREFSYAAIQIQNHKRAFEYFYEKSMDHGDKIKQLKQVPAIWNEKILIVEDEEPITGLLKAILNNEGNIDIVSNGLQGIEKVEKNYYKLIISDVNMPIMSGLEFYEHVGRIYPKINERFLFFTGRPSVDMARFFKKNQIQFLTKPSSINVIKEKALNILLKNEKTLIETKSA